MPHDIFISYSRRDLSTVQPIKEELEAQGFSCWMDLESVESGHESFPSVIAPAIEGCHAFLFFLSPDSLASPWTLKEIAHAEANGKRIVPIQFDDTSLTTGPVALELQGRDRIDWRIPEQKTKLFRDLQQWKTSTSSSVPSQATPQTTESKKPNSSPFGRKRKGKPLPGKGCSITISIAFLLIVMVGFFARVPKAHVVYHDPSIVIASPTVHESRRIDPPCTSSGENLEYKLAELAERSVACAPRPFPRHFAGETLRLKICEGYIAELVWCPPGMFDMGSPTTEVGREEDELLHSVELTHGFWMAKFPVTQREWRLVMGTNPSWFKKNGDLSEAFRREKANDPRYDKPDCPVEHVSWIDCTNFLAHASSLSGRALRLPTEAEWEYACRAGSKSPYMWGRTLNGDYANVDGRLPYASEKIGPYLEQTTPIGSYPRNAWGIFDMHGNVYEWTQDFYGEYPESKVVNPKGPPFGACRVVRGGNWNNSAKVARSAARSYFPPSAHNSRIGFRFCLDSTVSIDDDDAMENW